MTYQHTVIQRIREGMRKSNLEKSLEVQAVEGKFITPRYSRYSNRDLELKSIKIEHQLMRISTGWLAVLPPVCQLQLILFSFKM